MKSKKFLVHLVFTFNLKARSHQGTITIKITTKDIVLKIILNIKNSRVHTTAITIKAKRNDIVGITFRIYFFSSL